MKESSNDKTCENCHGQYYKHKYRQNYNQGGGAVYGLGLVGAAIFFIGKATTFWMGVLGLLKAIVWPAYLVYEALNFLIK
jgi:hypothetical protein